MNLIFFTAPLCIAVALMGILFALFVLYVLRLIFPEWVVVSIVWFVIGFTASNDIIRRFL